MKRIILICAALLAILALAGCVSMPATPTPVTRTDVWAEVQEAGVLVVGTSADYPPFEYYNARFQLTGFDVQLAREIGKILGVRVELRDYAFDGLYNALQLADIDMAIAAITVTPERQPYVDFSNDYFVSKDAVLANASSSIGPITTAQQLAQYRVGVQSGSIYESYVQETLVAPGTMPPGNVHVYPDMQQAVQNLGRNRIDLVLLDAQPAQSFAAEGGVKVVGESLDPQNFAIALPKGAESLRRVVNQALAEIVRSGVYAELAETYLGLPPNAVQPLPTPQPEPTAPATPATPVPPPAGCIDNMAYVADLNYDDHNMTAPPVMQPGQTFVKTWRIRNSGTCTWDSTYYLAYVTGNSPLAQMGGQPTNIKGTVAPGATYDISVNLTAPQEPGVYQGFWQMNTGKGVAFGNRIYVGIQVQAPQPTAAPTQTPSPTMSFTVNTTNITAGQCVTFTWNVQNVQAVYFYAQGEKMEDHGVAGQASQQRCPTVTTTYYLSAVNSNGTTETRAITINVTPAPVDAPRISQFTVTPPQINPGQCVDLRWEVQGTVTRITLTRGSTSLWDGAPLRGSLQDCPPGNGSIGYTLQATGPGGVSTAQQYVNVLAPTAVPPTAVPPTAVPPTAVPPTAVPPTAVPPTAVPPTAVPQPSPIVGVNWLLTAYNNGQGALVSPIAGTAITALFGADGVVSGTDSCNSYQAPYTVNGANLQIGLATGTSMACDETITAQANAYLAALPQVATYQVSGNQLTLNSSSGQRLLQYVSQ